MTLTITVPGVPPHCLSPNAPRSTPQWVKAKAKKQARHDAFYATFANLGDMEDGDKRRFADATVRITVAWPKGRHHQDGDNLLASLKWHIDAVAEALGVDDKGFRYLPVEQTVDPVGGGWMTYELEAV